MKSGHVAKIDASGVAAPAASLPCLPGMTQPPASFKFLVLGNVSLGHIPFLVLLILPSFTNHI